MYVIFEKYSPKEKTLLIANCLLMLTPKWALPQILDMFFIIFPHDKMIKALRMQSQVDQWQEEEGKLILSCVHSRI